MFLGVAMMPAFSGVARVKGRVKEWRNECGVGLVLNQQELLCPMLGGGGVDVERGAYGSAKPVRRRGVGVMNVNKWCLLERCRP